MDVCSYINHKMVLHKRVVYLPTAQELCYVSIPDATDCYLTIGRHKTVFAKLVDMLFEL
jgi:hypothetical protein